jgi:DNA-binding transcriptional MerR regulator
MFTIGILSRRTSVNIETIRYYERIGIIDHPPRTASGRRLFDDGAARRLAFIRHARELGFDLPTIRALLALQGLPDASCKDVTRMARSQLDAVESRMARLQVLKAELNRMIKRCAGGRMANCRIIETLTEQGVKAAAPVSHTLRKGARSARKAAAVTYR